MIVRHFNAEKINPIVNNPLVLKWIAPPGTDGLDLSELIENRDNIVLMDEGNNGGVVFEKLDIGLFEAHTNFFPGTDARIVIRTLEEIIDWMFTNTDCIEIVSKVPVGNISAVKLARHFLKLEFSRKAVWPLAGGTMDDMEYYALRLGDWICKAKLSEKGKWFHSELERQIGHVDHEDDPAHDRYVGLLVSMVQAGQPTKGVICYNRWAKFAGYEPVRLISLNPIVLDIKTALVITKSDGSFTAVESN